MLNPELLKSLSKQFKDVIPTELLNDVAQTIMNKMQLVTQEEFDTQAKVLGKTRLKLEELEKKVAEIEKELIRKNK